MPDLLEIDSSTVTVDGDTVDFAGEVGGPTVYQLSAITILETGPSPIRTSQLGAVSIQQSLPPPIQTTQLGIIIITALGTKLVELENPIPLNCWQPCASYGTQATVLILGG